MSTTPRFKFTATVVVSVLAAVLTLFMPGEDDPDASPARLASQLSPLQR